MKHMLKDSGIELLEPFIIHWDNIDIVSMSKNHVLHSKTKKYHFLREKVAEKEIRLKYVSAKEKIAYIFIKPLSKDTFEYL